MSNSRIWFLGAPDPEMSAIEVLLKECGEKVEYATINGQRVKPHEAYKTDNIRGSLTESTYLVECSYILSQSPNTTPPYFHIVKIDHHNHSDFGYGRPPEDYMAASSIGQVISVLALLSILPDWDIGHSDEPGFPGEWDNSEEPPEIFSNNLWRNIPKEFVFIAAADHCLGAAYQGQCPGVDADELMQWRVESRAKFQKRAPDLILADIAAARKALRSAPHLELVHNISVRDMRGVFVPELPEAAAREGECFVAQLEQGDITKIVCQSGSPEQISAFMQWAHDNNIKNIYGDPMRGFAGGIL